MVRSLLILTPLLSLTSFAACSAREGDRQDESSTRVAEPLPLADAADADAALTDAQLLEQCVIKQVGDRLQRCCRKPGAIDTCYDIANDTSTSCGDAGPDGGNGGMVGTISCTGVNFFTAFNLVYVAGQGWCAVRTDGPKPTVYACHPNPDDFLLDFDLACTIAGVNPDGGPCSCTIRNVTTTPIDPPSPDTCISGENVTDQRSCQLCCAGGWRKECSNRGYPDTGEWQFQCLKACDAHDWSDAGVADAAVADATVAKANPSKVVAK